MQTSKGGGGIATSSWRSMCCFEQVIAKSNREFDPMRQNRHCAAALASRALVFRLNRPVLQGFDALLERVHAPADLIDHPLEHDGAAAPLRQFVKGTHTANATYQ